MNNRNISRVILMGNKPVACRCLEYLIEKGIEVVAVVTQRPDTYDFRSERLVDKARQFGIPVVEDTTIYNYLRSGNIVPEYGFDLSNIDAVFSMLYFKRIKQPLINLSILGCINFHPAPLPQYRGVGTYNYAIYDNNSTWAVTAHYVDENFDTGDIIIKREFAINPDTETGYSLEQLTQIYLLALFKEVVDKLCCGIRLPRTPQTIGRYTSWDDFNKLRTINRYDSPSEIHRKIQAFWYPPYDGATIEINGEQFTLVDKDVLKEIGKKYHR